MFCPVFLPRFAAKQKTKCYRRSRMRRIEAASVLRRHFDG
jgi:hypothetical protein